MKTNYMILKPAKIIIFDVNNFKTINDTYGHSFGDYCLKEIGYAIKKTYGNYGLCYRIGGDEFSVILLKNLNNIEKLNKNFNQLLIHNKEKNLPSVSIGYSHYEAGVSSIQKVIENADDMMYKTKLL